MKYQFNEQELLSLFYDKGNDMRPYLTAPYLKNGYVCATEAHILIRIKAETLNGKYKEIEKGNIDWPTDNCNFIVSLQDIEKALSNIPQVEEEEQIGKDIDCEECDGEGEVEWEYQNKNGRYYHEEHTCPVCLGSGYSARAKYQKTGRMIPDEEYHVGIRHVAIKAKWLEILAKAMKLIGVEEVRCVHQAYASPCIFRIDDNIEIILMPYWAETEYHIEGRDAE